MNSVFNSIWQDVFGILILVGLGLWLYMKQTGKTFKELKEQVTEALS